MLAPAEGSGAGTERHWAFWGSQSLEEIQGVEEDKNSISGATGPYLPTAPRVALRVEEDHDLTP